MPKLKGFTTIQKLDHQEELLADRCDLLLYKSKVSKASVADYVGKSPQAIHQQFRKKKLSLDVLIAIATLTNATEEFVEWLKIS